ncbi:MAG: PEP-CTERM sorting domain-containing protein [Burkholderiales bacterium]|nr:PEP-CTERM sorting domain-containing protein [Burkholderiales bacterium]
MRSIAALAAVPEPTTVAPLAVGFSMVMWRRGR